MSQKIWVAAMLATTIPPLGGCDNSTTAPRTPAASFASVATGFSAWSPAVGIEQATPGAVPAFNTDSLDGCPFTSRDGKTFYLASRRDGGLGGIDIWVSHRLSADEPWGAPVNVGEPVNSSANDFCPTIDRDGHRFFFVSTRTVVSTPTVQGSCGGADIYETRVGDDGGFDAPRNLGCVVNSAQDEASPFPIPEAGTGPVLYFSSTRPRPDNVARSGGDLYRSKSYGGVFGPPELVPGVNSDADDGQPNLRRDGLELFFYSTRAGGAPDLYSAVRASTSEPWSEPDNLGTNVNTAAAETRPSLSWDGTTLYFGSTRKGEGVSDIYVTTRQQLAGGGSE
jgi:hypothetical protein